MTVDALLSRLRAVRKSGHGWEARCPAHDDQKSSLTVAVGDSGKLLLKCHAGSGCPVEEIVAVLGLTMADLFPTGTAPPSVVATYEYRDESGELLFAVDRLDPKGFRQWRPDGGRRTWNLNGVRRVLYRLPELLAADPDNPVYVAEGEKDCDALVKLGLVATTNPGGAGKWRDEYNGFLIGRHVVILPDNDAAGRKHAEQVARSLASGASSVRVVALPNLPEKGDVSNWLATGGTRAELQALVIATAGWTSMQTTPVAEDAGAPLPEVSISGRPLRDKSDDAIAALRQANDPPSVFVRGGRLVRVRADERDRPFIELLGEHELRGLLTRAADFVAGGKQASPPTDVVHDVLTVGGWPFPAVETIVEAPVLRRDGTVLDVAGYDGRARVVYAPAPGLVVPPVPVNPTVAEVDAARAVLCCELLGDFPFVDQASRANAVALLITPIVRVLIEGPVPLALLDKPQAGTGASLLADVVAIVATGRPGAMMSDVRDDEEWRKQITSTLLDGATFILIDNAVGRLRSKSLARALTATTWKDRILGKSLTVELPQRAVWVATGNNLCVGGDLARRAFWIRIDAKTGRPYLRPVSEFRHALPEWAIEHRGDLLAAILTIACGWVAAGRPIAKTPPIGGFTAWTRTVGSILAYAGVEGFLDNMNVLYEQIDEEALAWEAFLGVWFRTFADQPVTVREIKGELEREGSPLREALPPDLAEEFEGKRFTQNLGYSLRAHRDQVIGELRLERADPDEHAKVARWRVIRIITEQKNADKSTPASEARVMAGNVSPGATRAQARTRGNGSRPEDYPPSPASPARTEAPEREIFDL